MTNESLDFHVVTIQNSPLYRLEFKGRIDLFDFCALGCDESVALLNLLKTLIEFVNNFSQEYCGF